MNASLQKTLDHMPTFKLAVEQARSSSLSLLPSKFIYVPLNSIGIHEKPNNLRTDQLVACSNSGI